MSSIVILALMIVSGTCTRLPSREYEMDTLKQSREFGFEDTRRGFLRETSRGEDFRDGTSGEDFFLDSLEERARPAAPTKKGRKHKAFFINFPPPSMKNRNQAILNLEKNFHSTEFARRKFVGTKKNPHESQIHFIKMPPNPYTYVHGFGYISQPTSYANFGLQLSSINHVVQKPTKSPNNRYKPASNNPFVNVPVDFVSNGKPTEVYEWVSKKKKRPDSSVNRLVKGPYRFNGRPSSLYLMNSDGKKSGHKPIRLTKS